MARIDDPYLARQAATCRAQATLLEATGDRPTRVWLLRQLADDIDTIRRQELTGQLPLWLEER